MEVQLTGPKKLTLQSQQVAYILDVLATRPYREVNDLINNIFAQLKQQEVNREEVNPAPTPGGPGDGLSGPGPADR